MKVLDSGFVQEFINMSVEGYSFGWHERNGGNLSYRIKSDEIESIKSQLVSSREWIDIGATVKELACEFFLVTGTGRYFGNIKKDPKANIGIVEIDKDGKRYRISWGLENCKPTSEFPSHLMNHQVKKLKSNDKHRVIYHCHPVNLIALTFILPLEDKVFTRELWETMTECPVIFPDGIGVVPWMVPGGEDIAIATSKLMEKYDVAIWAHHGIFGSGEDFDNVFGLIHTVEKASEILVKVLSIRSDKLQTITKENFIDLAKAFEVSLPEEFLYDK